MTITHIIGTIDPDARAAVAELVATVSRGGAYASDVVDRLPLGRVVIHVQSDVGGQLAVIVLEDGVFSFHPLDAARSGRVQ